jgi:hypothetical protein
VPLIFRAGCFGRERPGVAFPERREPHLFHPAVKGDGIGGRNNITLRTTFMFNNKADAVRKDEIRRRIILAYDKGIVKKSRSVFSGVTGFQA